MAQQRRSYNTKQRAAVLSCLTEQSRRFLSVDEVYDILRDGAASVGRTTVYRTLQTLVGEGVAAKVVTPGTGESRSSRRTAPTKASSCAWIAAARFLSTVPCSKAFPSMSNPTMGSSSIVLARCFTVTAPRALQGGKANDDRISPWRPSRIRPCGMPGDARCLRSCLRRLPCRPSLHRASLPRMRGDGRISPHRRPRCRGRTPLMHRRAPRGRTRARLD